MAGPRLAGLKCGQKKRKVVTVNLLRDIPLHTDEGGVNVVVEVPAQSRVKLKYEPDLNQFIWSRSLSLGVCFPYDFGFLPQTIGGDGDALDALVYADVGSYPGVVVPARILGALRVEQKRDEQPIKRNDRILVAPVYDHRGDHLTDVAQLPARVADEIVEFFRASLALTGKVVTFKGWADATEAAQIVAAAAQRFAESARH